MWTFVYHSEPGSSHLRNARPCQDFSLATNIATSQGDVLLAVCSDGAGSAGYSEVGAQLVCNRVVETIAAALHAGMRVEDIGAPTFSAWFRTIHEALVAKGEELGVSCRELASTLLVAVASSDSTACAQLGDGAIVIPNNDEYEAVFWPDNGEYANTTYFLTDPAFDKHLMSRIIGPVDELAVLTDGLQFLALDFGHRRPHTPFFTPFFRAVREAPVPDDLVLPLRTFLGSDAVNDRTDDDKTLLIATRIRRGDA